MLCDTERGAVSALALLAHSGQRDRAAAAAQSPARQAAGDEAVRTVRPCRLRRRPRQPAGALPRRPAAPPPHRRVPVEGRRQHTANSAAGFTADSDLMFVGGSSS